MTKPISGSYISQIKKALADITSQPVMHYYNLPANKYVFKFPISGKSYDITDEQIRKSTCPEDVATQLFHKLPAVDQAIKKVEEEFKPNYPAYPFQVAYEQLKFDVQPLTSAFYKMQDSISTTVSGYSTLIQEIANKLEPQGGYAKADSIIRHPAMRKYTPCPKEGCPRGSILRETIIHLNDSHRWTREEIADWLDTLEEQPVFYPDVRSDDEKIEDARKAEIQAQEQTLTNWEPKVKFNFPVPPGSTVTVYNSDGTINNGPFNSSKSGEATYEVTFTNYFGAGYAKVTKPDGSHSIYKPDGEVSWSQ